MTSIDSEPPERSLDEALPFADFVQSLRSSALPLGIQDLLAVEKLVRRWQGTKNGLGDALAALLARNRDDLARIAAAFHAWFPDEEPAIVPPLSPPLQVRKPWTSRIVPWAVGLGAAIVLVAVAAWLLRPRPRPPDRPVITRVIELPTPDKIIIVGDVNHPPPPQPLSPPRRPVASFPWLAATLGAMAILTVATEVRSRARRAKSARRQAADGLSRAAGPFRYDLTVKPGGPPFPPAWVEDAATIIGRGIEDGAISDQIDVEETLRLTLREGARPVLAFEPPPLNATVLALEDTSPAMLPWTAKVEFLLAQLARQGIAVERWFFDTDPSLVSRERHGRTLSLERLADMRGECSLLVIATGEGFDEVRRQRKRLKSTLDQRWMRRSWLSPIANRRYWPSDLRRVPMSVWPWTRDGLRAMAWELASIPIVAGSTRRASEVRDVTADDVERMKRVIALVPHPTLALAGQLRKRYCPEVPEEVVLFLAHEGALHGNRVLLSEAEVQRLLAVQRRETPAQESRVREYLLEVLDASTPPADSVAHLRWQADYALQTVHVAASAGTAAPKDAVERLAELAGGPLAEEVQSSVELTGAPAHVQAEVARAARQFAARARRLAPRWAAPGAAGVTVAMLLALAAYWGAKPVASQRGAVIPHVTGAYQLTFVPAAAPTTEQLGIMKVDILSKDVPQDVTLYVGEQPDPASYTQGDERFVSEKDTGVFWTARAKLPEGNEAWSDPVWVPKMMVVLRRQPEELRTDEVHFEVAAAWLTGITMAILDDVALRLKQEPTATGLVVGHRDDREPQGPDADLDLRRALAVRDYLVTRHGIAPSRLIVGREGASIPVASNDTDEGRRRNRRVVITLTLNDGPAPTAEPPQQIEARTAFSWNGQPNESETWLHREWTRRRDGTWLQAQEYQGNVSEPEEIARETFVWRETRRTQVGGTKGVVVRRGSSEVFIPDLNGGKRAMLVLERTDSARPWTTLVDLSELEQP